MAYTTASKTSNYKFIAIFIGAIIGLAGIIFGVILIMQPQLINQKAVGREGSPRSVRCTFSQNSSGRMEIRNPETGKRAVKNLGEKEGCYLGDERALGDVIQECVPIEAGNCGNIGQYEEQSLPYVRFIPEMQSIFCTSNIDCLGEDGKIFNVCDPATNRCKEDLAAGYCGSITSPSMCNTTFFYDYNDAKKSCRWYTEGTPYASEGCYAD